MQLSKNSVRSRHIKNGQVRTADLGRNAVQSSKIADGALLAQDFAAGQLPRGEKGEKGEPGATGPAGPTFGAVKGTTPPSLAAGGSGFVSMDIEVPVAGKLLVFGRPDRVTGNCNGMQCTVHLGLYPDGEPVPGSDASYGPGDNQPLPNPAPDLFGLMPDVSAGTHQLEMYVTSSSGSVSSSFMPAHQPALAAIALGR